MYTSLYIYIYIICILALHLPSIHPHKKNPPFPCAPLCFKVNIHPSPGGNPFMGFNGRVTSWVPWTSRHRRPTKASPGEQLAKVTAQTRRKTGEGDWTLGIQSPCQMMIGVYNHLLRKVFRFHYHSQKVIGCKGGDIPYFLQLVTSYRS